MIDYKIKLVLLLIIFIIIYLFNNNRETFQNLNTFIKTTNYGQWNFSSYNPYTNLNDYTDNFYFVYDKLKKEYNIKEIFRYNKSQLESLQQNIELNKEIIRLLNKYNNEQNKLVITNTEFRKLGLMYTYKVPLITAYDKLNYIKNKTKLKDKISKFLIKDLKKFVIDKYINPYSITNEADLENNIIVNLQYTKTDILTNIDLDDYSDYGTTILKTIKKYLKFDIINNGTNIPHIISDTNPINIKFKIIAYDLDETIKSIINDKVTKLYKILFTDILNTNDNDNILSKITSINSTSNVESQFKVEKKLQDICIYGSGLCENNKVDLNRSPNCSVPNGNKTIKNSYTFIPNINLCSKNTDISTSKQIILDSIRREEFDETGFSDNNCTNTRKYFQLGPDSGNYKYGYNCNVYDISHNLNGNNVYTLDIYDTYDHFDNKHNTTTNTYNESYPNTYGIINSPLISYFNNDDLDTHFNINIPRSSNSCEGSIIQTGNVNIKTQLDKLNSIPGLDNRAINNVKSIILAKADIDTFTNYVESDIKNKNKYIRLRILGKAYNFLEDHKNQDPINNSIKQILDAKAEFDLDITKNKLYGALHYIMEKHIYENNNEFNLNDTMLFNDNTTLKSRYLIIKSIIPENTNSILEKLLFMTTREKIYYFDKNKNTKNPLELELKLIEKMSNDDIKQYFEDINKMDKDVNERLKLIIASNSNNISRIHKKLNNLKGGDVRGGTIKPFDCFPSGGTNCIGVGIIYPNSNVETLLLNNYNNMSLENVTAKLNHMAYYKNKLYIVGDFGYFTIYDLTKKMFTTLPIFNKTDNSKLIKIYENLNFIYIYKSKCLIVGNNSTIIYNEDFDKTTSKFLYKKTKYSENTDNYKECIIDDNDNKYILSNTKVYNFTNQASSYSVIQLTPSTMTRYKNLFKVGSIVYCSGIDGANRSTVKVDITVLGSPVAYPNNCLNKDSNIFIQYNDTGTFIIYHDNNVQDKINIDFIHKRYKCASATADHNGRLNYEAIKRIQSYAINTGDKISSVFVNNINIGAISEKLYYYNFNINSSSLYYNVNIKANSNHNIADSKLFCIQNNSNNNYSNIFHYGSAGQIVNYNINHHNTQLDLKYHTGTIVPNVNFSGYDNNNNPVYTFNNNTTNNKFKINGDIIRLKNNQNIYITENNNKIIKYEYSINSMYTNGNYKLEDNYYVNLYSNINNSMIKLDENIYNTNVSTYKLLSNKFRITTNKYTVKNKNEFVSFALFVNNKFKIWLKPDKNNLLLNVFEHELQFNTNDTYILKMYVNGINIKEYILEKFDNISTNIRAILHDKKNVYNNNILEIKNSIGNTYDIYVVPESASASIFYKDDLISNNKITLDNNINTINIGIKNNKSFKSHKITIIYGTPTLSNLKDYELSYLIDIDVNKAYNYLSNVNKTELTLKYLLEKYNIGQKDDIQIYLALITNITNRNNLEHKLINSLDDNTRNEYIKTYLIRKKITNVPVNTKLDKSDKIVEIKPTENEILLKNLRIKLEKMKLEKELLSNQYNIEQRNRMFDKLNTNKTVKKSDIDKLDTEIKNIDDILKLSETSNNTSKTFFEKLLGFFTSNEKKNTESLNDLEIKNKKIILEKKQELKKQLDLIDEEKKKEIQKLKKENEAILKKIELENKVKVENTENFLKSNANLEIKKQIIDNEKTNIDIDKLFSIQKNLIKKQKSLLQIIKTQDIPIQSNNKEDISIQSNNTEDISIQSNNTEDSVLTTLINKIKSENPENINKIKKKSPENINKIKKENLENINKIKSKNIITKKDNLNTVNNKKDLSEIIEDRKRIKQSIMQNIENKIKKEKKEKKEKLYNKKCTNFIDCYFKNLNDSFYTSYKKENTFIKNATLPKEKKPPCKPKKDCNICYLETNGTPNSINIKNNKTNELNSMALSVQGNVNTHFTSDYEGLPDCPFDDCMSCENINNYTLYNENTYNDKLLKKYTKNI